jgi:hypothetical protein
MCAPKSDAARDSTAMHTSQERLGCPLHYCSLHPHLYLSFVCFFYQHMPLGNLLECVLAHFDCIEFRRRLRKIRICSFVREDHLNSSTLAPVPNHEIDVAKHFGMRTLDSSRGRLSSWHVGGFVGENGKHIARRHGEKRVSGEMWCYHVDISHHIAPRLQLHFTFWFGT